MSLLNNGEYTYTKQTKAGLTKSALDLTFTTKNLATIATWSTNDLFIDHFGITLYLQTGKLNLDKTPKRLFHKANWELYKEKNDEYVRNSTNEEINTKQKLESENKKLVEMFNKSAEHAIPLSKVTSKNYLNNKNPKLFVTERTKELNNRKNQLVRLWKKEKDNDKKIVLLENIRYLEKLARQEELEEAEQHMIEWCENLDSNSNLSNMWGKIKNLEGKNNPQLHPDPQKKADEMITNFTDRAKSSNLPKEIQDNLKKQKDQMNEKIQRAISEEDHELDKDYNMKELKSAIRRIMTAPGGDAVTHIMVYEASDLGLTQTLRLINASKNLMKLVDDWKSAIINPILKLTGAFRPISLLIVVCKIMERMILNRLDYRVNNLNNNLFAYTKGKGTQDAIAGVLNKLTTDKKHKIAIFLDIEKAFELINSTVILEKLVQKNVKGKTLAWIKDF